MANFYLGLDFGTSGARAILIDSKQQIRAQSHYSFQGLHSPDWCQVWRQALFSLILDLPQSYLSQLKALAINGTSATVLLCDYQGHPLVDPLFYNDDRARQLLAQLKAIAPRDHLVLSATSSLAKLLWWDHQGIASKASYFLHQADWLGFLLHGQLGISDYHNALKLGYDPENLSYPNWLTALPLAPLLPQVVAPGSKVSTILPSVAEALGLSKECYVCAGTTDSIAAFLASGLKQPGEAVTSLGSTLVLKLLSSTRIENLESGIYSHRLGDLWLTGGASNSGGAVLRHFFSDQELDRLSTMINPEQPSGLDYYPLIKPGERFPYCDPYLKPRLEPRPQDPVVFLQGLLEGITQLELQGYTLLQNLGASPLTKVYTAGGGAKNPIWQRIRTRMLKVPVTVSPHTEAAYGSALLALNGLN